MDLHLSYICSCEIKVDNGFFYFSQTHIRKHLQCFWKTIECGRGGSGVGGGKIKILRRSEIIEFWKSCMEGEVF